MKHLKTVISIIITLALFASCKKPTEPETGNIKGVVIDDSTGIPVEGVLVTLAKMEQDTTDSLGKFYFGDVEEGTYSLVLSKYPYRDTILTAYVEGGKTWEVEVRMRYIGPPEWYVVDSAGEPVVQVFFVDYWTGWALCGGDGIWWGDKLYRTMDGDNFTLVYQFSSEDSVRKIFFVNSQVGWAVGMKIWKTEDGGYTWVEQMNVDSIYHSLAYGLYFYDENEGFVVGGGENPFYNNDFVLHTIDGGMTWIPLEPWESDNSNLYALFDIKMDGDRGVIVGQHVYCIWEWVGSGSFYTTNRGIEWHTSRESFGSEMGHPPFHRVTLYGNGKAIKIWRGGLLAARSEDMGHSWFLLDTLSCPVYDIFFIDETHGWIALEEGIYFTRDEGTHWWGQWAGGRVTSLYMLDANWGYAGTYEGCILRYERRK